MRIVGKREYLARRRSNDDNGAAACAVGFDGSGERAFDFALNNKVDCQFDIRAGNRLFDYMIIWITKRVDFERDATFFTSNLFVVRDFDSALAIFINVDKAEYVRGC